MTFSRLWAFLAVALPVLASLIATMSTVDLAYQIQAGELMLRSGAVLRTDPFTFTAAGLPWLDQQWGAQVVFALIYRAAGWAGLAIVRAVLIGVAMGLVYGASRWEGAGRRVAAWLTLGGFLVAAVAMGLRPQLLGMVLFAATLAILSGRRRRPGLVWLVPVLACAWANTHGSFFLAPAAVVVACLEDRLDGRPGAGRLLLIAAFSFAATAVGPFGLAVWPYVFGLGTNPVVRRLVSEWQPTSPLDGIGLLFYCSGLAVVVLTVAIGVLSRWTGRAARIALAPRFAWLGGLFLLGIVAQRGVAWWAIAAPVAVAGLVARMPHSGAAGVDLAPRPATGSERSSRVNAAIASLLVVAGVVLLPMWRSADPLAGPAGILADAPASLARSMAAVATPADRVWNPQAWGSWLELAAPGIPLAVDSRIEVIPPDVWDDALALDAGDVDWAAILDRRRVTIVVASKTEQRALIPLLRASPAWQVVDDDTEGTIFVRANRP